jgi:hypothetical protein
MSMEYKQWRALSEALAVELWAQAGADMMIPAAQGRAAALRAKAASDANQADHGVKLWRGYRYSAGEVLIALEHLGYSVEGAKP